MSGESGNIWPLSSGAWEAAGAALATNIKAFANCVLKLRASSPHCCASWVMSANSCRRHSSFPGAVGLLLASSCSFVKVCICCSNPEWWHHRGRNCLVCRSVTCRCRSMIYGRWSHTICTSRNGCECCATLNNTSWACANTFPSCSNPVVSCCMSMSAMMVPWFSGDTWAARGSVDPDIATNQAHLPVPIICINFGRSCGRGYYNNEQNLQGLICCCCCCCVSLSRVSPYRSVSLAIARFLRITREPRIISQIPGPKRSESGIVNM